MSRKKKAKPQIVESKLNFCEESCEDCDRLDKRDVMYDRLAQTQTFGLIGVEFKGRNASA